MQLYYFKSKNFGDELNVWMWDRLFGSSLERRPDAYLSGIGTILSDKMPLGKEWFVFGSGVGYRPKPQDFGGPKWTVLAVRGPLTAEILDIDRKLAVTDSAILLAALEECAPIPDSERSGIAFMPHLTVNRFGVYRAACRELGIDYIDPHAGSVEIIQQLRRSRLVIADAMHAAIVSDTLRVPWVPVASSNAISSFKWIDWASSMDLAYQPQKLPAPSRSQQMKDSTAFLFGKKFLLSDNSPAAAIRDFRMRQSLSTNPYFDAYVRGTEALARSLRPKRPAPAAGKPRTSQAAPNASPSSGGPDLARMVAALDAASKRRPFLSSDAVFQSRLGAMMDKVEFLKRTLES